MRGVIPNGLTVLRILLTPLIVYLIVVEASALLVVLLFAFSALTDLFDGILARKFKWESSFGAKADMVADRTLWAGVTLTIAIVLGSRGELRPLHWVQLIMLMSRELLAAPFALRAFWSGKAFPSTHRVAKLTTLLQGIALPALYLSIYYPAFIYLSLPLTVVVFFTGYKSARLYIRDVLALKQKR